jgi:hypothetical protein
MQLCVSKRVDDLDVSAVIRQSFPKMSREQPTPKAMNLAEICQMVLEIKFYPSLK